MIYKCRLSEQNHCMSRRMSKMKWESRPSSDYPGPYGRICRCLVVCEHNISELCYVLYLTQNLTALSSANIKECDPASAAQHGHGITKRVTYSTGSKHALHRHAHRYNTEDRGPFVSKNRCTNLFMQRKDKAQINACHTKGKHAHVRWYRRAARHIS